MTFYLSFWDYYPPITVQHHENVLQTSMGNSKGNQGATNDMSSILGSYYIIVDV